MILNTVMLSFESQRLAGYILTRSRSMFLDRKAISGSTTAWLYHCPNFYSPLQLMDACYYRIPIMYREKILFVDPITRHTFKSADQQDCSAKHLNVYQPDVDKDNSWIELTLSITRVIGPDLSKAKEIQRQVRHSPASNHDASIYTYAQMLKFWSMITDHSQMKGILQKVSRFFLNARKQFYPDSSRQYGSTQNIHIDYLISPDFWRNEYTRIYRTIQYYLERCGIIFASFLVVKFIVDALVLLIKILHIHKLTGQTFLFGKIMLAASYNILFTSVVTSIFAQNENNQNI